MNKETLKSYRKLVSRLREHFPTTKPVKFKWKQMQYELAIADCCDGHFCITLNPCLKDCLHCLKSTVMHEYAHCLGWNEHEHDHGVTWALAYSAIYQKFEDNDWI